MEDFPLSVPEEADTPKGISFLHDNNDEFFMREALKEAQKAYKKDEVPVGAIIVHKNRIIARAYNQVETLKDATAHAEMIAITQAAAGLGDWRLNECALFVTKEPCFMCAGACVNSRLGKIVFGVSDAKCGACGGTELNIPVFSGNYHNPVVISGVLEKESLAILQSFFKKARLREQKNKLKPEEQL